jgi:hypothetical protein
MMAEAFRPSPFRTRSVTRHVSRHPVSSASTFVAASSRIGGKEESIFAGLSRLCMGYWATACREISAMRGSHSLFKPERSNPNSRRALFSE